MAIIQMISQGKSLSGLPSHIEVSPEEATQLIEEINSQREQKETQHHRYKFLSGVVDLRLSVLGRELSKDEKLHLLADWTAERMSITFDGITIKVVIVTNNDKHYHY